MGEKMIVLELCSGTKSISETFREQGHECFTVDNNPETEPDLCTDILTLDISRLPLKFQHPDVVWASPPCTTLSVASISRYWKNGKPRNSACLIGLALALRCREIIEETRPKYFFIENPRGLLRKQAFMLDLPRHTITYCQYGERYQKPTDIWSNAPWIPRPACRPGDSCHAPQPKGYRAKKDFLCLGSGVQGLSGAKERGRIPLELCREIVQVCERGQPEIQARLNI